jgi:hypothetical protein
MEDIGDPEVSSGGDDQKDDDVEPSSSSDDDMDDTDYVAEGTKKAVPETRPIKTAVDDASEVVVTESLTLSERLKRKFIEAQQNGLVIDLEASDEKGECVNKKRQSDSFT